MNITELLAACDEVVGDCPDGLAIPQQIGMAILRLRRAVLEYRQRDDDWAGRTLRGILETYLTEACEFEGTETGAALAVALERAKTVGFIGGQSED